MLWNSDAHGTLPPTAPKVIELPEKASTDARKNRCNRTQPFAFQHGRQSLGKILDDTSAIQMGATFLDDALHQIDDKGYFIEAGGYDSSYNGVSCALALRILMMEHDHEPLRIATQNAFKWQLSRIDEQGRMLTDGNSRVTSASTGESFLGRKKDVDVGHTIEALSLASRYFENPQFADIAQLVLKHYTSKR